MPNTNRRSVERVKVSLEAQIYLLFPELTLSAMEFPCRIVDLSERGAMVTVKLSPEAYTGVLQKVRYCRLEFEDHTILPEKITGRAVWIEPVGDKSTKALRIGLYFEHLQEQVLNRLQQYIQGAKSTVS